MVDPDGSLLSSQGYMPWGETRFGSVGTEYQFTGQFRNNSIGLDYFNARWYDPILGRWSQPDSIVPEKIQGIQALDRFAYSNNNPLCYSDPSGHIALLGTAAIGAAISFLVNYGIQINKNVNSGLSLSEAASWSNINHQEIAAATVGGFVGGLTMGATSIAIGGMGLVSGLSTITQGVVGGAVSNVFSGQAEALTNTLIDQVSENTTLAMSPESQGTISFSPNYGSFLNDAQTYGLGDTGTMVYDGVSGAIIGGLATSATSSVVDAGTPSSLYLGRKVAPWVRPVSLFVDIVVEDIYQTQR